MRGQRHGETKERDPRQTETEGDRSIDRDSERQRQRERETVRDRDGGRETEKERQQDTGVTQKPVRLSQHRGQGRTQERPGPWSVTQQTIANAPVGRKLRTRCGGTGQLARVSARWVEQGFGRGRRGHLRPWGVSGGGSGRQPRGPGCVTSAKQGCGVRGRLRPRPWDPAGARLFCPPEQGDRGMDGGHGHTGRGSMNTGAGEGGRHGASVPAAPGARPCDHCSPALATPGVSDHVGWMELPTYGTPQPMPPCWWLQRLGCGTLGPLVPAQTLPCCRTPARAGMQGCAS